MSDAKTAVQSGSFKIGGDLEVHRLGFGAMRLTGKGIWGPPDDAAECRRTIERLSGLGIDFVDTADSYGPHVSEELLAEFLKPDQRKRMVIATKGGLVRHGPDIWLPVGRPEYLKQCVLLSMRRLKVDRLDLWQLHRIDPKVPRDEQFGIMAEMQKQGLIRHLGLSEVSVDEIAAASKFFKVATVQNLYNLAHRQSEAVLDYCTKNNIGFIPWYPLAAGDLAAPGGLLDSVAKKMKATPSQVALAWVLRRSPVMLPIPGTSKVKHLEENTAAAALRLSDADFKELDETGRAAWAKRQAK
jgi:aryl-alcohol dehydrogenase-like predicted oxidoreductase